MKKINYFLILLINFSFSGISQETDKDIKFTLNDTVFFEREIFDGVYHAIFIDTNKDSKYYNQINNFEFGEFDQQSYNQSLFYFKENKSVFNKFKVGEIPTEWVVLKNYKGNLYNYYPSDFMSHFQIKLTDSTVILYTGEGPLANKIDSFEKISNNKYKFRVSGIYTGFSTLIFHIIDVKKGIAVIENQLESNSSNYCLMIDSNKSNTLPIIVNYCETRKWREFNFEQPNYKQLLSE
jgi:hypothetical protein